MSGQRKQKTPPDKKGKGHNSRRSTVELTIKYEMRKRVNLTLFVVKEKRISSGTKRSSSKKKKITET